jgi:N-acetylglucosamine kinase-like BadF-type ATPase
MTVVLGVDGGGTGSHAIVADHEGSVLGFGKSGPSNWEDVGIEAAAAALKAAVREAFSDAGVGPEDIDATVFGLAGVDFPSDEAKMGGIPQALGITTQFKIVNDSFVALRAGANHPWGVVIIAGSGSVVAGKNAAGETFRTLGLGPMFGDFGSATDVSGEAIMAVASQLTGQGPRTSLTDRMCEATRSASAIELIEALARGRVQTNRFTSVVFEVAEAGDLVSRRILEHAGSALGEAAGHIARRLQMDDSEFELVLTGSMFRYDSRLLVSALEVTVKRFARFAMPARLEAPPMVGAILLALEMASMPTDPELHATFALASNQVMEARNA